MENEPGDLNKELNDGLISVQKAYERRRAQLEESISDLERQHTEWLNSHNGEKLLRLKFVTAFKKNGEVESVYSERVKLRVKDLRAEIEKNADEARKRLAEKGWGKFPETPPEGGQS
jgi:hypothetical protein